MIGTPFRCFYAVLMALAASVTHAAILYESAGFLTDGVVGSEGSGTSVSDRFYSGAFFELSQPRFVSAIGGHFRNSSSIQAGSLFGIIVSLDERRGVPDFDNRVVAQTLLTLPPGRETITTSGRINTVLPSGTYAILFGTNRFGAPAGSYTAVRTIDRMPVNDPRNATVTYTWVLSREVWSGQSPGIRFFVEGGPVPEPTTALLAMIALGAIRIRR